MIVKVKPNRGGFVQKRKFLESKKMNPEFYRNNSTSLVTEWVRNIERESQNPRAKKAGVCQRHLDDCMFEPTSREKKFAKKAERRLFMINKALKDQKRLVGKDDSFDDEEILNINL